MTRALLAFAALTAALVAPAAGAQTDVSDNPYGGLHYHVAAPRDASWSLDCRFRPVTIDNIWLNHLALTGHGARPGRLPGDNGSCILTKTGGEGPVGIAVVKNGAPTAAGTNDPARPAVVNVF